MGGLKVGMKRRAKESRRKAMKDRRRGPGLTREQRWAQSAADAVQALGELKDIQEEFQQWYDNLSEGLQQTPVGSKLESITQIDLETAVSAAEEAEGAEVPLGFGRD